MSEHMRELIEASSLGTPEAKAARASVSDEQVAKVIRRVRVLELARDLLHAQHSENPERPLPMVRAGCAEPFAEALYDLGWRRTNPADESDPAPVPEPSGAADARAAVERVHVRLELTYRDGGLAEVICDGCDETWPCETIREIDQRASQEAHNRDLTASESKNEQPPAPNDSANDSEARP